jgi:hypothetical protein
MPTAESIATASEFPVPPSADISGFTGTAGLFNPHLTLLGHGYDTMANGYQEKKHHNI